MSKGKVNMEIRPLHTKVYKDVQLTNGAIVLEDPSGFPRNECNLYCINSHEKIVWIAERPAPQSLFSRLKLNEDCETFSAYTVDGYACDLEIKTGKLLSKIKIQ